MKLLIVAGVVIGLITITCRSLGRWFYREFIEWPEGDMDGMQ